ncbi:hypothetical protein [Polymorphospora lycopeni]|uniref:Uncharacterized protein n=1 Tax=Polymorphospora lycopeni TaxID=3140240 RepID=A0ABV5CNQ8_9ACTN
MPPKRKKWQARHAGTTTNHSSQPKAYEALGDRARAYFANPTSISPHAEVWVDVGDSRGWRRYDEVNLAEWTHLAPAKEA